MTQLTSRQIKDLFCELDRQLKKQSICGELFLVGGAVMCLVYESRDSTVDIDAVFHPSSEIRAIAGKIGRKEKIGEKWLNDGVKGFLSEAGDYKPYLNLENLKAFTATPFYLLAMKCLAMRIGAEFHDVEDVRFLIRYLNLETYEEVLEQIGKYYPLERFPAKTKYALKELLSKINR